MANISGPRLSAMHAQRCSGPYRSRPCAGLHLLRQLSLVKLDRYGEVSFRLL
jgi:hypothetical protein